MYVYIYVCMYVCAYVYVHVHVHVYVYVCTVCMYLCMMWIITVVASACPISLSLFNAYLPKTSQNNAGLRLQDVTKVDSKKLSACPPCGKP